MAKQYDCIVCGSCVADVICHPVDLDAPIGRGVLHPVEPVQLKPGGITCNASTAISGLGLNAAVFSFVGSDPWGVAIRQHLADLGVDDSLMHNHPTAATSSTVVTVNESGDRSFLHGIGATKQMKAEDYLAMLPHFAQSQSMLFGYYSLNPQLEPDLADVFRQIRATGCMTAMDAAGQGGTMNPLGDILPQLDLYVPSVDEAVNQTGESDPEKMIAAYRSCGAPGVLGVKLGSQGVLLSDAAGQYHEIPAVQAPGEVIDTTGAGDNFLAGLIAGLVKGWEIEKAGRLGTATAACCVTKLGGSNGVESLDSVMKLASL